jgi:hypothetical protein
VMSIALRDVGNATRCATRGRLAAVPRSSTAPPAGDTVRSADSTRGYRTLTASVATL